MIPTTQNQELTCIAIFHKSLRKKTQVLHFKIFMLDLFKSFPVLHLKIFMFNLFHSLETRHFSGGHMEYMNLVINKLLEIIFA